MGITLWRTESFPHLLSDILSNDRGKDSSHRLQRQKRIDHRKGESQVMKIVSLAKVKAKLSAYIEAARSGPIVITKNGSATAVLIAVADDDELERLLLAHSPKLRRILQKSEKSIRAGRGISHEDFWAEMAE